MPHVERLGLLAITAMLLQSCAFIGPSPSDVAADMAYCVDQVNQYRATVNLPALTPSDALAAYASQSAEVDGTANVPHQHFMQTDGGGVARAETELLDWTGGSVHTVLELGLKQMWDEGPGGEHYKIIVGPYAEAGCGLFISSHGIAIAQDFR